MSCIFEQVNWKPLIEAWANISCTDITSYHPLSTWDLQCFWVNCRRENIQVHSAASLEDSWADKRARTGSILTQHFHKAAKKKRTWRATPRSPRFCRTGKIKLQKTTLQTTLLQSLTGLSHCCYRVWRHCMRHRDKTDHMGPPQQQTADHFNYISAATWLIVSQTLSNSSIELGCKSESAP